MTVQNLRLVTKTNVVEFRIGTETGKYGVSISDGFNIMSAVIDRSQAHMLKLWLEEHLK